MHSTTIMNNQNTTPVATGSAGSSSHTTMLHDNSDEAFYLMQLAHHDHEDYLGGGTTGLDWWDLAPDNDTLAAAADPAHDLFSFMLAGDYEAVPYFSDHSLHAAECIETSGVDPRLLSINTECATLPSLSNGSPPCGDCRSPGLHGSTTSANITGPSLVGEDPEEEGEQPFLLERSFGDDHATDTPSVKEGGSNGLEEEGGAEAEEREDEQEGEGEGEEDEGDKDGPYNPSHEAEAATSAPPDDVPCLGLTSQTGTERKVELNKLLEIARVDGAKARESGLDYIIRKDDAHTCTGCGKIGRRDRLVAHVVYKHLGLKTWACPHCLKSYATRDDLSHHLKAIMVACLCGKSISKNNWYAHSLACKACLRFAGKLSLKNGRIVGMEADEAAADQAGTSAPRSLRKQRGSAQGKKRKRDDSGDGTEERQTKRAKRDLE